MLPTLRYHDPTLPRMRNQLQFPPSRTLTTSNVADVLPLVLPSHSFVFAFILLDSMDDSFTLTGTTTLTDDASTLTVTTTLPDDIMVPYLCLGLDSHETVIEKYGFNFNEDNPWKALEGVHIDPEHLSAHWLEPLLSYTISDI
jgi:hypothetical protein